jgi:hypothetical protein
MPPYDVGGHLVHLEITPLDRLRFWAAARAVVDGASVEKTTAGLEAVLPGLLERVGAQLPTMAKDRP